MYWLRVKLCRQPPASHKLPHSTDHVHPPPPSAGKGGLRSAEAHVMVWSPGEPDNRPRGGGEGDVDVDVAIAVAVAVAIAVAVAVQ